MQHQGYCDMCGARLRARNGELFYIHAHRVYLWLCAECIRHTLLYTLEQWRRDKGSS